MSGLRKQKKGILKNKNMKEIKEVAVSWKIPEKLHKLLKTKAKKDRRAVIQTAIIILEKYFETENNTK